MSWKFLRPNAWNIIITLVLSILYYMASLSEMMYNIQEYNPYWFLAICGRTCSQLESIFSLILFILFVPLVYVIISFILSKIRRNN